MQAASMLRSVLFLVSPYFTLLLYWNIIIVQISVLLVWWWVYFIVALLLQSWRRYFLWVCGETRQSECMPLKRITRAVNEKFYEIINRTNKSEAKNMALINWPGLSASSSAILCLILLCFLNRFGYVRATEEHHCNHQHPKAHEVRAHFVVPVLFIHLLFDTFYEIFCGLRDASYHSLCDIFY